jgi:rhamnulokinase
VDNRTYCAFDLGAGSGRLIAGTLSGGVLSTREVHRFETPMLRTGTGLFWNVDRIFAHVQDGLRLCVSQGSVPGSIGIDSWGVDYALLGADGELLGPPRAYRDPRNAGAFASFTGIVPPRTIYEHTGVQLLPFNTLYQLHAEQSDPSSLLSHAATLLFIPEIFNYLLCGTTGAEFTFATTSQLYNPRSNGWDPGLVAAVGVPPSILPPIRRPAAVAGTLLPQIRSATGLGPVPVVSVGSHDTASAVAAVPARGDAWAYISSGTWSLVGMETPEPLITDATFEHNFTNEGGVGSTFRLLKNVTGMWLLTECKKVWDRERRHTFDELVAMFDAAAPFGSLIDPDAPDLANPPEMPGAIARVCRAAGQPLPSGRAATVRCVFESLALKYRFVLDELREVTGRSIDTVHIVGGGSQNRLLCQCTADATGMKVHAGPVEASAVGNILVQAMAAGEVASLQGLREVVAASYPVTTFTPQPTLDWDTAYRRFVPLVEHAARRGA